MRAFHRIACLALFLLLSLVDAAFINFENCLGDNIQNSEPKQLQFVPLFVDAQFNTSDPHNLTLTIYGNVTGQQVQGEYPPPSDPQWDNNDVKFGKIANVGSANNYSTLLADFQVLTYDAYNARASQFCEHLENDSSCPLGPIFNGNASDPSDLHAFTLTHDFGSPYHFSTLASTLRVLSGDDGAPEVVCVSANITPALGSAVSSMITWLPAAVLILKGIATIVAAIWSPWGSSDIFRWSSNYGRDEDLLRLVTPGFGDCLQYIQFVTLMGSLTLQFPGYFQPAVSQTAWSLLLFNESFVSHGDGTQSLHDGVYVFNGNYGISTMRQLIGMSESTDVWACMAVFLAVIALAVIVLCQIGFLARWIYRVVTKTAEEDLRQKNLPFTLGNMVRLLFNFFILPIVALSLFQFVISGHSPTVVVAMAGVLFALLIISGGWILRVIFSAKPRTFLFDDMPTVLLYGPLYNTYSDSAAPFALVPVLLTFMRGVAFGAVQPSGTAQIIILAICEIILILTLNGFRPFQGQTSMNAYHTFFSIVRLITVLLCIAFIKEIGVSEASRGWIGYAILLLHACVLLFGFFLNSAQTLIEVAVRSLGLAGSAAQTGAVRGNILGWRALKKRRARSNTGDRASMSSHAAMLNETQMDQNRSRSMSASSQQLLNQSGGTPNAGRTSGFDNYSAGAVSPEPGMAMGKTSSAADGETFYRPPRRRTLDILAPGAQSRTGAEAEDVPYHDSPGKAAVRDSEASGYGKDSPLPAYIRDRADSNGGGQRTDYAVREVDQYYRGPALSDQPKRKLKTGPADPISPAASAQSWFQRLMFGVQPKKKKEKEAGKGFEVVRSSRMNPDMQQDVEMQTSPPMHDEPYRDSPEKKMSQSQASPGAERSMSSPEDNGPSIRPSKDSGVSSMRNQMHPGMRAESPRDRSMSAASRSRPSADYRGGSRSGYRPSVDQGDDRHPPIEEAPTLAPIETVGGMDIPSRWASRKSAKKDHNVDMGQEWLREVDNLNWDHTNRSASGNHQESSNMPAERSHARRSSGTQPPPHLETHIRSSSPVREGEGEGGADFFDEPTGFLHFDGEEDEHENPRPSSFMNKSHHRTQDSIHRNSIGANAAMQGSSAEFSDGGGGGEQEGYGTAR